MSEKHASSDFTQLFDRTRINLETYQLLWCHVSDQNATELETRAIIDKLRTVIDYVRVFHDVSECDRYLDQTTDTTTIIVCSDTIAQSLIPRVHHLKHTRSFYVYYQTEDYDNKYLKKYNKIQDAYNDFELLLADISKDVESIIENEKKGFLDDLNTCESSTEYTLRTAWPEFIDFICNLPYPSDSIHRLASELRSYYIDNKKNLRSIEKFVKEYSPENAIWWYTRPGFLYSLLNRAFRQHNIPVIILFGFYVKDLFRQLRTEYAKYDLTDPNKRYMKTFRSQIISVNEVESFTEDLRESITITSFLSTSLNEDVAVAFLNSMNNIPSGYAPVLWEINLDLRCKARPFADISHLSHMGEEKEVLLMPGTTLVVKDVVHNKREKIYRMILELENNGYVDREAAYKDSTFKRTLKKCIEAFVGDAEYVHPSEVGNTFDGLSRLYPSEKEWLEAYRYQCIGNVQSHVQHEDYNQTIAYHEQAIELWQGLVLDDSEIGCTVEIVRNHLSIAFVYEKYLKNDSLAKHHRKLGMDICIFSLKTMKPGKIRAQIYELLSRIYEDIESDQEQSRRIRSNKYIPLEYKKLEVEEHLKYNASDLDTIATCYDKIARMLRVNCSKENDAIIYYEKASKLYIQMNQLKNASSMYENCLYIYKGEKNDLSMALKYRLKIHELVEKNNQIHPYFSNNEIESSKRETFFSHERVADAYMDLKKLTEARHHLLEAKRLMNEIEAMSPGSMDSYIYNVDEKLLEIEQLSKASTVTNAQSTYDSLQTDESHTYPGFRGSRIFRGTKGFRQGTNANSANVAFGAGRTRGTIGNLVSTRNNPKAQK